MIDLRHFKLLQIFGRDGKQKKASPEVRATIWKMMCQGAGIPAIDHSKVVEEWKNYIAGESEHSGIAINGDIDPQFVSIGITYKKKITSAHTTPTASLLRRILGIYARAFPNKEQFLEQMESMCREAIEPKNTKSEPRS